MEREARKGTGGDVTATLKYKNYNKTESRATKYIDATLTIKANKVFITKIQLQK